MIDKRWRRQVTAPDAPRANANGDGRRRAKKRGETLVLTRLELAAIKQALRFTYLDPLHPEDNFNGLLRATDGERAAGRRLLRKFGLLATGEL